MAKKAKQTNAPTWTNTRVRLGDLVPWDDNPRMSSKKQAQAILESWDEFGQIETIAVSPNLDVYDGHQRLSALLTKYGPDYEVDARQISRLLTDAERRRLTVKKHAGATGSFNWDMLANWDSQVLLSNGLDADYLKQINTEAAALRFIVDGNLEVPGFQEYDESAADDVEFLTCPHCGKTFPK